MGEFVFYIFGVAASMLALLGQGIDIHSQRELFISALVFMCIGKIIDLSNRVRRLESKKDA